MDYYITKPLLDKLALMIDFGKLNLNQVPGTFNYQNKCFIPVASYSNKLKGFTSVTCHQLIPLESYKGDVEPKHEEEHFLKQPLKLEMFVPEKPEPTVDAYMQPKEVTKQYDEWLSKYGKKVLFKNLEISIDEKGEKVIWGNHTYLRVSDLENRTVEDLTDNVNIKLTESAVKHIFS